MKAIKYLLLMVVLPCQLRAGNCDTSSEAYYLYAKQHLENMLNGSEKMSYEDAIYQIENAWWEGGIDKVSFTNALDFHFERIKNIISSQTDDLLRNPSQNALELMEIKKGKLSKATSNYAIYTYMSNTSIWLKNGGTACHKAFNYSYKDPMGTNDWTNTQVTHLINEGDGNCFALASLFKIFSERLNSDAVLCTAPGHIYIRHADYKGTFYNVELSSRSFPGTGTIETLTYTPDEATRNGISLRELDLKQSIGLCLVYLAKGYEYKFGIKDDDFLLSCAETALKYDDHNLSAMLLKAEVLENSITNQKKEIAQLQKQKDFQEYQKWICHVFNLGYREMPFEMKNLLIKGWTKDTLIQLANIEHTPKRTKNPNIIPTRQASLSWGLFDEEIRTKPFERFGNTVFDTKKQLIVAFLSHDILYNQYNFDPVVFAWNPDPLAHKSPGESPYIAMGDNPILNVDPDGRLKINYNETTLAREGLTVAQVQRFTNIVNNVEKLVANNPQALDAIVKTTGLSPERVMAELHAGSGPNVNIQNTGFFKSSGDRNGIYIDPSVVKTLASIRPADKDALAKQALGVALTLLHEYGHYGDQVTNDGNNTGQFDVGQRSNSTGSSMFMQNYAEKFGGNNLEYGTQQYRLSPTGHRGTDIEVIGFGVDGDINDQGVINVYPRTNYAPTIDATNLPTPPSSLPANASGHNVLNTLDVH